MCRLMVQKVIQQDARLPPYIYRRTALTWWGSLPERLLKIEQE